MKCIKCKFAKFNLDGITFICRSSVANMEVQCLLRQLCWLMLGNRELAKKTEKILDKTIEEMDEGEEWRKPQ